MVWYVTVTTLKLPNRVFPGLSHPFPEARKSLRLKILPVNPLNAIFCEDFLAAALCFQYFAEKRGEGGSSERRIANSRVLHPSCFGLGGDFRFVTAKRFDSCHSAMHHASLTNGRRKREILVGVSGEDFPAFFPPTPVEFARRQQDLDFLLPGVACARFSLVHGNSGHLARRESNASQGAISKCVFRSEPAAGQCAARDHGPAPVPHLRTLVYDPHRATGAGPELQSAAQLHRRRRWGKSARRLDD